MPLSFSTIFSCLSARYFAKHKYQLSICMVFRDEAPYLKEWIEFHRLVGVDHFYLRSHKSVDHYAEVLAPYIQEGLVEFSEDQTGEEGDIHFWKNIHRVFYVECLKKARGVSKWVAFLDSDEFLFPSKESSVLDVLKDFEQYPGIGINWQMFGTSDVEKIQPNQLLIESLTHCASVDYEANIHIKSIVKPEFAVDFINPHYAVYWPGYKQVNTDGQSFAGPFSPYVQVDKLRINHYWLRDEYFFHNVKIKRRLDLGYSVNSIMKQSIEMNQKTNDLVLRYVPALKEAMDLN